MTTLKSMYGVTRMNIIRNEHMRECLGVTNMTGKMREKRLRWMVDVLREEVMTKWPRK